MLSRKIPRTNNTSTQSLHILGAGNLGLLIASSMRVAASLSSSLLSEETKKSPEHQHQEGDDTTTNTKYINTKGKLEPSNINVCLLLRDSYRPMVLDYNHSKFTLPENTTRTQCTTIVDKIKQLDDYSSDKKNDVHWNFSSKLIQSLGDTSSNDESRYQEKNTIQSEPFILSAVKHPTPSSTESTSNNNTRRGISIVDIPVELIESNYQHTSISRRTIQKQLPNDDDESSNSGYIQNLLITTKAMDAVDALQSILHRLDPIETLHIILMTNGILAVEQDVRQLLDNYFRDHYHEEESNHSSRRIKLTLASITHGAYRISDPNDNDFWNGSNLMTEEHYKFVKRIPSPFHVVHAGIGKIYLPQEDTIDTSLSRIWNKAGLYPIFLSKPDMYALHWKKLCVNCVINPLTALRQCNNGALLFDEDDDVYKDIHGTNCLIDDDHFRLEKYDYNDPKILYRLVWEVSTLITACLNPKTFTAVDNNDDTSSYNHSSKALSSIQEQLQYTQLLRFVKNVIRDTNQNHSSMYQDVTAKRPTEIKYLNGWVVNVGQNVYSLNMTCNEYICREIEKIQNKFQ